MKEFLAFTMYAPMASWGDIAVGEMRGSWDRPSRSAVLGLLAAALGILREDDTQLGELHGALGVAVRVDRSGTQLIDYHTAQTAPAAALRRSGARTRAQALASCDPETILSARAYRQDAISTIVVWLRAPCRWALEDLAAALVSPVFVLYAGRKSNPLGAPLDPAIVAAQSLSRAVASRGAGPRGVSGMRRLLTKAALAEVSHDPCDGFASELEPVRQEVRRDDPVHRGRWQFCTRTVQVGRVPQAHVGDPR